MPYSKGLKEIMSSWSLSGDLQALGGDEETEEVSVLVGFHGDGRFADFQREGTGILRSRFDHEGDLDLGNEVGGEFCLFLKSAP